MKVLLVQSSVNDACRVSRMLEGAEASRVVLVHVLRVSDALKRLRQESFDAVLIDPGPPDARGLEVLQRVQDSMSHLPVVVFSGHRDQDRGHAAHSGHDTEAPGAANHAQGLHLMQALRRAIERKHAERYVEYLAYHDGLTHLPNRRLLLDRLGQAVVNTRRAAKMLAVVFLDVDDFKSINDTLGHAAGDQLLKAVAERLTTQIRSSDTLARLGADEFTVVLPDIATPADARRFAAKLRGSMTAPFAIGGHPLEVSVSIGVSVYPDDGTTAGALLRRAEDRLQQARRLRGRGPLPDSCVAALLDEAEAEAQATTFAGSQDLRARIEELVIESRRRAAEGEDAEAHRRIADRLERALELWGGGTGALELVAGGAAYRDTVRMSRAIA